jgi:hypothetical protein
MFRTSLPKLVLVLVLSTALATPSTGWAAGRRFSSDDTWVRGSAVENLMITFWSYLVGLWGKEGCGIDPDGLCKTVPSTTELTDKNGCGLDPHGGCTTETNSTGSPTTDSEAGCGIDPHGGCVNGG